MTAAELIEELKKFPPDTKVYFRDIDYGICDIDEVGFQEDTEIDGSWPYLSIKSQKLVLD